MKLKTVKLFLQLVGAYAAAVAISTEEVMRGVRRQFIPTVHKIKLQNEVKLESLCESASGTHSVQLRMNFKSLKFV